MNFNVFELLLSPGLFAMQLVMAEKCDAEDDALLKLPMKMKYHHVTNRLLMIGVNGRGPGHNSNQENLKNH